MKAKYSKWVEEGSFFAKNNNASFKLLKTPSIGFRLEYFTMEITIEKPEYKISISQSSTGTDVEVDLSYLKFEFRDTQLNDFDLSLYQKGFFEKIFNSGSIKSGNKAFDKKFGIYCPYKRIAARIFSESRVQDMFLSNKFLVFSVQKNNSLVVLKSMETKLYEMHELQKLLDDFVYIINVINNAKYISKKG